jgi:hypothetical protein
MENNPVLHYPYDRMRVSSSSSTRTDDDDDRPPAVAFAFGRIQTHRGRS